MTNVITRFTGDRLYINALYLMGTNFLLVGMGFFFWVICARWYSPDEVGLASTIISAALLLISISTLGLNWGLIRFLPEVTKREGGEIINSTFTIVFCVSIILSIVFLLGLWLWSPKLLFLRQSPLFLILFVGMVLILTLSPLIDSVFVANRRSELVFYRNAIWGGLKLIFPISLVWLGSIGIVGSYGLSAMVSIFVGMFLFLPRIYPRFRFRLLLRLVYIKKIFKFSMGNYIAGFLGALPTMLFPLIITQLFNPRMTAYFFIAWTIGIIFQQISHAISLSLLVEGSHDPEQLQQNLRKAAGFNGLIFLPLILIFFFFGDWILSIFGTGYSANGFALLRVLALVSPLVAFTNIYLAVQRVEKNVSKIVTIMGIIGVGTLTIGFIFLRTWGLVGISLAWGLSHTLAVFYIVIDIITHHSGKL